MKAKKILAAGLAVTTLASTALTGCGNSDSSETADGKKNSSVFIFANDHESKVYKDMIKKFEEDHKDTIGKVDIQITTQEEYSKTLTGMMTAGDLPDVFYVGPEAVEQYVENGYIADLQPILDEKGISTDGLVAQEAAIDTMEKRPVPVICMHFRKMPLYLPMLTTKTFLMKQVFHIRILKIHIPMKSL